MFGDLKKHKYIFVTGPHRSGTTICARMIANDTGHDFVIEDEFGFSRLYLLAAMLQADYGPAVIQCPFLADIIHDLEYLIDLDMSDCLVVFMHRYRPDILDSEERAKVNFDSLGEQQKTRYYTEDDDHISDIRYEAWQHQCTVIPHAMDVSYESLRDHPMWLEDRKDLPFQHIINKPPLPKVFRDGIIAAQDI